MLNGSSFKSKYTERSRENLKEASVDSAEVLAKSTIRTSHGIALAKAEQAQKSRERTEKAFMDIAEGTATVTSNLVAAAELSQPTILLFTPQNSTDQAKPLKHQTQRLALEQEQRKAGETDKLVEEDEYEEDYELKKLKEEISILDSKLKEASNDSIEAYEAWRQSQEQQLVLHAEATGLGRCQIDSYDVWNKKRKERKQLIEHDMDKAQQAYRKSLDEFRSSQRDYQLAWIRKFRELTSSKEYMLDDDAALTYILNNFITEKDFYRELRDKDVARIAKDSPLAKAIQDIIRDNQTSEPEWQNQEIFNEHPLPSGLSQIMITHSELLFGYYLEASQSKVDDLIKFGVGAAKTAAKAFKPLKDNKAFNVLIESLGVTFDQIKFVPSSKKEAKYEFDKSMRAIRQIIPREAGLDIDKLTMLFDQINGYLETLSNDPSLPELMVLNLRQTLSENKQEYDTSRRRIEAYECKHRISYGQPSLF